MRSMLPRQKSRIMRNCFRTPGPDVNSSGKSKPPGSHAFSLLAYGQDLCYHETMTMVKGLTYLALYILMHCPAPGDAVAVLTLQ